jgi:ferredoxin
LIKILPKPVNGWSKIVVPFVTYGGISSGISLDEAGKLLRKSGRIVLAGMKISSSHRMTRAFMKDEYNKDRSEDKIISTIQELIRRVKSADLNSVKDNSKHLKYQSLGTYIKSNLIFKEKEWHKKRYPNILIDSNQCIKCGKCAKICPVCHLQQNTEKSIIKNVDSQCIHCFNCIIECPQKAISLLGDLDKAKIFFGKMVKKYKENPDTCLYPK